MAFWLGVAHFVLGSFTSFVPGAQAKWFVVTALLLLAGTLVSKWKYRLAAFILGCFCGFMIYDDLARL